LLFRVPGVGWANNQASSHQQLQIVSADSEGNETHINKVLILGSNSNIPHRTFSITRRSELNNGSITILTARRMFEEKMKLISCAYKSAGRDGDCDVVPRCVMCVSEDGPSSSSNATGNDLPNESCLGSLALTDFQVVLG
ncbi:hypothetical protein HAX54_047256, partial [Datura stramonium]|nr:hypothetical protein [Datura stramonium]